MRLLPSFDRSRKLFKGFVYYGRRRVDRFGGVKPGVVEENGVGGGNGRGDRSVSVVFVSPFDVFQHFVICSLDPLGNKLVVSAQRTLFVGSGHEYLHLRIGKYHGPYVTTVHYYGIRRGDISLKRQQELSHLGYF